MGNFHLCFYSVLIIISSAEMPWSDPNIDHFNYKAVDLAIHKLLSSTNIMITMHHGKFLILQPHRKAICLLEDYTQALPVYH